MVGPGGDLDPAELVDSLAEQLARWKLPRYIVMSDEALPRLGNGKIDRVRAKALLDPAEAWDRTRASASS